ncbi:uncharacterized protein LOC128868431 isoform X1 [Anastrepha ludens]|uniref:uncharacterized protein LOC128868431 isoform X1 n=1 Tax=Anastrepha ludens TaxID=28586 RepID=UPI0023B08698|nr:uncharacterized protein LOC128868431 isoform X1 [Anastrepha ludens]
MPKKKKCRVRNCKNDARFFAFPKNPVMVKIWRENLGIQPGQNLPEQNSFVCIQHFEEYAVGSKLLKRGAIPTLKLGYDGPPPHSFQLERKGGGRYCCIKNCPGDENPTLFAFRRYDDSWYKACNITRTNHALYICGRHFDKSFITKNRLRPEAFPTLNLFPQPTSTPPSKPNENMDIKRNCCIENCVTDGSLALFSFPKMKDVRMRWMKTCGITPSENSELYICARHFHSSFLTNNNKTLGPGAVPSLKLDSQPTGRLPTLQNSMPSRTKLPLEFEQHYFLESKRQRRGSQDTDVASFISEHEELIYNIQKSGKSLDAASVECDDEQITRDINDTVVASDAPKINSPICSNHASLSNNLELSKMQISYKNDQEHFEKRLAELEARIEFQSHKCNHEHFEKRIAELEAQIKFQSQITQKCDHEHFEKKITALEARLEFQLKHPQRGDDEYFEKKISDLTSQIVSLKSKYHSLVHRAIIPTDASEDAITFAKMIVDPAKKCYDEKEKYLAQNLTYISSKSYDYMREDLGFNMPHKSILQRWRPNASSIISGIDDDASETLKTIVSRMSESERLCQIMFDEIDIVKAESPSSKKTYGSKASKHSKCCFFMVKGLFSDWKYMLPYYIGKKGFSAFSLLRSLNQNLDFAKSVGLKVKAIVCAETLYNAEIYKVLGVTEKKPYILQDEEKIHGFFDYFCLIKSIRNSLLKYDIQTVDGVVSFKLIKKLYAIDQVTPNLNLFPKLTFAHINPYGVDKMNVTLATQLLSHSVAVGIEKAINHKLFGTDPHPSALKCVKATQNFIQRMNDLFDEFNHRSQYEITSEDRTSQNYIEKINNLKDHLKYIYSLEQRDMINLPFKSDLILTTKSMINFYQDLFRKHKSLDINLLGNLNQDALNTFLCDLRKVSPTENEVQTLVMSSRREFEQLYKSHEFATIPNRYDNLEQPALQIEDFIEEVGE